MQKEQHRQVVTPLPRMVYTGARRLHVAAMQQADRTAMQAFGSRVWPIIIELN